MHILYLTPEFGGTAGGIGTSLAILAEQMHIRGHQVTVVTRESTASEPVVSGCDMVEIPCGSGHLRRWLLRARAAAATLRKVPDLIHAPEWQAMAIGVCLPNTPPIVTRLDTPSYVIREQNYARRAAFPERLTELAERHQTSKSRLVLAASNAIAESVAANWGVPDHRIAILRNPALPPPVTSAATLAGSLAGSTGTVFVGRFERRKGCDLLPALAERLLKETSKDFTIVGDIPPTEYARRVESQLRQIELRYPGRLHLTGRLPHSATLAIIAAADLILVPSRWENAPMVLLEAMALAKPVIVSQSGGMPELIDNGHNGFVAPTFRNSDWFHLSMRILNDNDLAQGLGQRAQLSSRAWSAENIAIQAEALYQQAAG